MIRIIPKDKRHFADHGWLKTNWLFSFGDYYDPENISHGTLRVFNDDYVEPHTGFSTHPHREMEIITIVLNGEITHKDSMGNEEVIRAGEVQSMSAGTGVYHSEHNGGDEVLHLYQIWIFPEEKGLKPSYDQKKFDPALWKNKLYSIASGRGNTEAVRINADAEIFRATLEEGAVIEYKTDADKHLLLYLKDGGLEVNGNILRQNDQLRASGTDYIRIKALEDAEFILIDVV